MKNPGFSSLKPVALLAALVLGGCASVSQYPPGTPYEEVVKGLGNPQVSCPTADGRTRMIWSQEPMGEQVWVTTVGSDRLIGKFQQVMQPGMFDKLNQGSWTAAQVRCEYGAPAKIQTFPDKPEYLVWEYRFMGGGDDSFMMLYVSFNKATNQMVGYSTGPDPELNLSLMGR